MKKIATFLVFLSVSFCAAADTTNCQDLYVGSITINKGEKTLVVFKNARGNTAGSYAQNFQGWTEDDKQAAISLLLAAKLSGHRVNVATELPGGCGIQTSGSILSYVQLANLP